MSEPTVTNNDLNPNENHTELPGEEQNSNPLRKEDLGVGPCWWDFCMIPLDLKLPNEAKELQ